MSDMKKCAVIGIEFPRSFFGKLRGTSDGLQRYSYLGTLYINVSQRAKNGVYHAHYCEHHDDRYTRPETAITMDPSWVHDPYKFGIDILLNLGMPRYDEAGRKLSLDRINNNKGYFIGNLRWATALQQAQNATRVYRFMAA